MFMGNTNICDCTEIVVAVDIVIAAAAAVGVVVAGVLSKSWRYYNMSRCLHNVVHGA